MKTANIIFRALLGLLLITPILGAFGIVPGPTRDLYTSDQAFGFINILMETKYIVYIEAFVFTVSIVLIILNRMALASLLILPVTVCIIGFHAFLDGGLLSAGAVMGNILLVLNIYFLWQNRKVYKALW